MAALGAASAQADRLHIQSLAPVWQHPYVNVFRLCRVDDWRDALSEGDVSLSLEPELGKKVYNISGSISALNFIQMPKPMSRKTLGLTGRYMYIQVKLHPARFYVINMELVTSDKGTVRCTISNLKDKHMVRGVHIRFIPPAHRWYVLGLDLAGVVDQQTATPGSFASVRSIQLCSDMFVRNIFTANVGYNSPALMPREMRLTHNTAPSWTVEWLPLPRKPATAARPGTQPPGAPESILPPPRPAPEPTMELAPQRPLTAAPGAGPRLLRHSGAAANAAKRRPASAETSGPAAGAAAGRAASGGEKAEKAGEKAAAAEAAAAVAAKTAEQQQQAAAEPAAAAGRKARPTSATVERHRPSSPSGHAAAAAAAAAAAPAQSPPPVTRREGLQQHRSPCLPLAAPLPPTAPPADAAPPPERALLRLERLLALEAHHSAAVVWLPDTRQVAYSAGWSVVLQDTDPADTQGYPHARSHPSAPPAAGGGAQRLLQGHTAAVSCIAVAPGLLASGQEGRTGVVRLWDYASGACLAAVPAAPCNLSYLDLTADGRAMAAVGQEPHGRTFLALWDVADCSPQVPGGQPKLVAKAVTDFSVKVAKLSPWEDGGLVTAGRDSVRLWRIKDGTLRGFCVPLGDHRTPTTAPGALCVARSVFTAAAFTSTSPFAEPESRKVLVASAGGAVFQVNYHKRCLECVFQLHEGAINGLAVGGGLVVTASDDKLLRVWPSDFSEFLLEAEHEAPVTSLSLRGDSLAVAATTSSGALGVTDIASHSYRTLLRSHTEGVLDCCADPVRSEAATGSADGSVRVWSTLTGEQLYQFDAPGEAATSCAYAPPGGPHHALAVGFSSGAVRVFAVGATSLLAERRHHSKPVARVLFSPDASRLYSAGTDCRVCVFDGSQGEFLPLKFLPCAPSAAIAVSDDGLLLAVAAPDNAAVNLYDALTLQPRAPQRVAAGGAVRALCFSASCKEVLAATEDSRLLRISAATGALLRSANLTDCGPVSAIAADPSGRMVVTAGLDAKLRVWQPRLGPLSPYLLQNGANGAFSSASPSPKSPQQQQAAEKENGAAAAALVRPGPGSVAGSMLSGWTAVAGYGNGFGGHAVVCQELPGHSDSVSRVTFCDGGRRLISCAQDGAVCIWRVAEEEVLRGVLGAPPADVMAAAAAETDERMWRRPLAELIGGQQGEPEAAQQEPQSDSTLAASLEAAAAAVAALS